MKENSVRAKKHLGQHFLRDLNAAKKIADWVSGPPFDRVVEIGSGTGVLSQFLLQNHPNRVWMLDVDKESIAFLHKNLPSEGERILEQDFLNFNLREFFNGQIAIAGNFPYNISSQIFFRVLEFKELVPVVVCMLQKEVAKRLASEPGNKEYGILSVLLQAYYKIDYGFTVNEGAFDPPPKVKSGVIKLTRLETPRFNGDFKLFTQVVKAGFNQRRKTLRNALKLIPKYENLKEHPFLDKRAEQLSVEDFGDLISLLKG